MYLLMHEALLQYKVNIFRHVYEYSYKLHLRTLVNYVTFFRPVLAKMSRQLMVCIYIFAHAGLNDIQFQVRFTPLTFNSNAT